MSNLNIAGFDKAEVLAALFNNSRAQGMGTLAAGANERMTPAIAQNVIDATPRLYFDYVQGRVLKVDLSGNWLNPYLYDRDIGEGAAARALAPLGVA